MLLARPAWLTRRRALLLGGAALAAAAFFAVPVPRFDAPVSTVLLDRDGKLLGATIAADGQWRMPRLERVPERLARAVVAQEDRRFWAHPGVDPLAIGRALALNLRRGEVVSGASTLSMQVARLSRPLSPRTLGEKLWEALLALRLEAATSKEQILLSWLEHAPFGGNVVGARAASWRYFGKDVGALTWAEAATLAVLPNSPALVHPGRRARALLAKRDRVLRALREAGAFDDPSLALALAEPLPSTPQPLPALAPQLVGKATALHTRSGEVTSTVDAALQARATEILARHRERLGATGINHAAAVVVDVETNEVLAWVGNLPPRGAPKEGDLVDVVTAPRSTGSLLKPFLYAAMLDQGELLPRQLVLDTPFSSQGFHPENFSRTFSGAVPASQALARSLNVPAARMLADYGVDRFHGQLEAMGLPLARPADEYGLALILGGSEAPLLDLTGLYAGLARTALHPSGTSQFGTPRWRPEAARAAPRPAGLGPGAAYLTLEALREVERPGAESAWRSFRGGAPVAWKTGTSYGFRDGWAIGVTPRYAIGVWTGNASGHGEPGLMGFTAAAPILFELFELVPAAPWFEEPAGELAWADLCDESGMRAGPNCRHTHRGRVPKAGLDTRACEYCALVHVDASGEHRVHAGCRPLSELHAERRFVLPPGPEAWYRRSHAGYRPLPPWLPGCEPAGASAHAAITVVYPEQNSRLYVPVELDGRRGRLVVEAAHRDPHATLFWHLDDGYVGSTHDFHHLALEPTPGPHVLTVVDELGESVQQRFTVLEGAQRAVAERR